MPPFDAVSFDLDRTLCRYERPGTELLAQAFAAVGVEPFFSMVDFAASFDSFAGDAPDVETLRRRCFRELAAKRGVDRSVGEAVAEVYNDRRDPAGVVLLPGAREAVETAAAGGPVALITNGYEPVQRAKLEAIGLEDAFDAVVYAGTDTAFKPDPAPFETVASRLGVDAEATVHVGDSLAHDVAGAKGAGWGAVWVADGELGPGTPAGDVEPDYVIEAIASFPPWRERR
ncbi:MAG: HAD family hydrolase [Halobacteriales archaeon]